MQASLRHMPDTFKPQATVAVQPTAAIWTPVGTNKFRLQRIYMTGDIAGDYVFTDGNGGPTLAVLRVAINGFAFFDLGDRGQLSSIPGNALYCLGPTSSHISGIVMGEEVPGSTTL